MNFEQTFAGMRVTVMGLGLHGGGLEVSRRLARAGAELTVTDLRDAAALAESIRSLEGLPIRYVLGRHEPTDFQSADLVIKNPAVPRHSPLLAKARRVATDISLFICFASNPILAVTGSKGKSSIASALAHSLHHDFPAVRLGGNITTSPLSFLDELGQDDPVVLELSSWQLGDLDLANFPAPKLRFRPRLAVLSNILRDHQNYYHSMEAYTADKARIFRDQTGDDYAVLNYDDPRVRACGGMVSAETFYCSAGPLPADLLGAFLTTGAGRIRLKDNEFSILGAAQRIIGPHQRSNLLTAGLAAVLYGAKPAEVRKALTDFPGLEHRLEFVREYQHVRYYNDSAATIPEAVRAALAGFQEPVHLITGGTDKELDFTGAVDAIAACKGIYLLAGSATVKLQDLLDQRGRGWDYHGADLADCLYSAGQRAQAGEVVLFSPGAASFELFANEFHRGRVFKKLVQTL